MLLLLRIATFVAVLAPDVSNARSPVYPLPPYPPQDRAIVLEHTERYVEKLQCEGEYQCEHRIWQIDDWRDGRKQQIEDWREYRKQQIEGWRENRKRQIEELQQWR